ncbi:hypothetical protein [Legionella maioricensis]|uniref:Uncharacterized protein n=1 Tax=Legionella maioricensis TaxID=2896528 RepID=A0A9X2D2C1_9GAMM|nr:hypothetical protein [Legionella maioricensis]MCL9685141.1 hypothetical protein [Legionella maioricensis]MCL9688346.1 hypothetical protein [Legionella maioricensis]
MNPLFTKFQEKLLRLEKSLEECEAALDLEFFKNLSLNPAIGEYNDKLRVLKKTAEEQQLFKQITEKLESLRTAFRSKKASLMTKEEKPEVYLIGKNFILGPNGLVDELPKAKIDRDPPLPQEAIKAIEEGNKAHLLRVLYNFCEEKFAAKEPPGFVSLKMIDALWDMGTRGHELAELLKEALTDYQQSSKNLSDARHIALKNTTALIYQKFWNSGDASIERYALDGFKPKYISGLNETDFSYTKPNPLLSKKVFPSKISENESLLFNHRGQLRKIMSDCILNPKAEEPRMTPTVYVTNARVWTDKEGQSQEARCFGSQGRFWSRWHQEKMQKESVEVTEDGELPQVRKLTDRHGPGW